MRKMKIEVIALAKMDWNQPDCIDFASHESNIQASQKYSKIP